MELIAISARAIGADTVQACSARDLHKFLDVGRDFSNWIKDQISRARLIEGRDFLKVAEKGELSATGQTTIAYYLTIEAAKHIAMLSQTDKGFEVREYFIECERRAAAPKVLTQGEMLLAQCQMLVDQERRLAVTEDKIKRIEAKQAAFEEGSKYFTVVGFFVFRGLPSLSLADTAQFGKRATAVSKARGVLVDKVRDPRYGLVGSYHESVLESVLAEFLGADAIA